MPDADHCGRLPDGLRGRRGNGEPAERRDGHLQGEPWGAEPVVTKGGLRGRLHHTGVDQGQPGLSACGRGRADPGGPCRRTFLPGAGERRTRAPGHLFPVGNHRCILAPAPWMGPRRGSIVTIGGPVTPRRCTVPALLLWLFIAASGLAWVRSILERRVGEGGPRGAGAPTVLRPVAGPPVFAAHWGRRRRPGGIRTALSRGYRITPRASWPR